MTLPEQKTRDTALRIRLTEEERARAVQLGKRLGLDLSSLVRFLITKEFGMFGKDAR